MGLHSFLSVLLLVSILTNMGCTTLPKNNASQDYTLTAPDDSLISQLALEKTPADDKKSAFIFLEDGTDAFVARMALTATAQTSIDAQYYIWHNDVTGNILIHELMKSAQRGVRVRLLVDDINLSSANDESLSLIASHPNASVRVFNPFDRKFSRLSQLLARFGDVTRRMHNKSFVVDGKISIIGGRNIGDEYFGADNQLAFSDLDVLSIGPIVNEVSSSFDLFWNSPLAYPIELLRPKKFDTQYIEERRQALSQFVEQQKDSAFADKVLASQFLKNSIKDSFSFFYGEVELLYDKPEKISNDRNQTTLHLSNDLAPHIKNVTEEFLIISPYFVPGEQGIAFLLDLEKKGVQVKIITNSLASTDVPIVHAGYKTSRKKLLKGHVDIYEVKANPNTMGEVNKRKIGSSKSSLHAKTFAIDRESLFVGSLNLDPRSFIENTEIGMLIHSKQAAQALGQWFESDLTNIAYRLTWDEENNTIKWSTNNNGVMTHYTHDPDTSWWLRRWVDVLSLLPIESQL